MSNNTYFYLSSLGSNDHAVFDCTLPEPVTIAPFSEVRCVSCRINPSDNLMEIDDTNNLFYLGVDHWIKVNSCVPLLPVQLTKGLYDMTNGEDDYLNLNAEIQEQVDKALEPYCLLRGGSTVSINDNRKLKITQSTMGVYKCPTIALTADVQDLWENWDDNLLRKTYNGVVYEPIGNFNTGPLDEPFDAVTYHGLGLGKVEALPQYYISPPIVTGLSGATDQAKHISHIIECDFTGLKTNNAELGATHTNATDYFRFYFGDTDPDRFGSKWAHEPKMAGNGAPVAPLDPRMVYALEFSNSHVNIRYNQLQADGSVNTVRGSVGAGGQYSISNKFQIICAEWEDEFYSYYSVTVKQDQGQGGGFQDMGGGLTFQDKKNIYRQYVADEPNRLAAVFKTNYTGMGGMVRYTASVDNDDYGFFDGAYQVHTKNDADIQGRLLSVFTNNVQGTNSVSERVVRTMENAVAALGGSNGEDVININYMLDKLPNADILSWDSDQDDGVVTSNASYTTGLQAEGAVSGNNRDFPCFYLSAPSLPIKNYTGNRNEGFEQTFICPVELSLSQTSQRLYTSKQYTENYVSLTNSYPMDISSIQIRITDINNVPSKQLQKYTIIVLEIRESPYYKNEQLLNTLKSLADRNVDPYKLIGNQ